MAAGPKPRVGSLESAPGCHRAAAYSRIPAQLVIIFEFLHVQSPLSRVLPYQHYLKGVLHAMFRCRLLPEPRVDRYRGRLSVWLRPGGAESHGPLRLFAGSGRIGLVERDSAGPPCRIRLPALPLE